MSNDIGSFLGPPPGNPQDDSDLYARWVQLGTFQPVLRLHSSAGNRLPWDYPEPADSVAASFLRLREALVPYTYTLADHSVNTGLPITSPLYLDYPGEAAAYSNPGEYLYGPDMLVAPATTPGNVTTERIWFPPGKWTDWFTGATFQGPSTQTLTVPLDRMPVFVKAGGIIPEQAPMDHVGADPSAPITLRVYPGPAGRFTLYQDAGSGTGYEKGQYSLTPIGTTQSAHTAASTVDIGPARGSYPGQAGTRSFDVDIAGVSRPSAVLLDGQPLAASDWTYDPATHTVTTAITGLARTASAQITEVGGVPSTTTAGSPVTLTGQNFGSSQGSSYLTLAQGGTSWGAPYDGAKLTITNWSDTSITFTLPPDSGPYPLEPGTATITVTVDGQSSAAQTITITS